MRITNMYRYCITYKRQCPKARKNGFCRNADRESCKEDKAMIKLIFKMPLYGRE
jgi:hypothetical protein